MNDLAPPPQAGKYNVILCDPPWPFNTWSAKGAGKSPSQHYNTMTMDQICDLPVSQWAAPDCALFLWVTWPIMEKVMNPRFFFNEGGGLDDIQPNVFTSWGFKYSGLAFEWCKKNPETGKFAFGTGYGTRKNLEPCLLFRRGKPYVFDHSQRDFLFAPRREHSRKPDEQYAIIEKLYDPPYLEMFATQQWLGWDTWGYGEHVKTPIES